MPKSVVNDCDDNETHSINISIFKPDGLFSFWNWFSKKNKSGEPTNGIRNLYKFKISKNDLENFRKAGFDLEKLQNADMNNRKQDKRPSNVVVIPKNEVDPTMWRNVFRDGNTKPRTKKFFSKSTISIQSKQSITNFNYVSTVRSQRSVFNSGGSSKASFKVGLKSSSSMKSHNMTSLPSGIFLKSVPTAILQSNTQKKIVILGKPKQAKTRVPSKRYCVQDGNEILPNDKEGSNSVFPMLLSKMKSMEEQLNDIGSTTRKLSEVVSQKNLTLRPTISQDSENKEKIKEKPIKSVASHRIYAKNIQGSRRAKPSHKKKIKKKSKTALNKVEDLPLNASKGFNFNDLSEPEVKLKNTSKDDRENENNEDPRISVKHEIGLHTLPTHIFDSNFPQDVGFTKKENETIMKMITEFIKKNKQPENESVKEDKNPFFAQDLQTTNCESNLTRTLESKPTFEWKHSSLSVNGQLSNSNRSNCEENKFKKSASPPEESKVVKRMSPDEIQLLYDIVKSTLPHQVVQDLLKSSGDSNALPFNQSVIEAKSLSVKEDNIINKEVGASTMVDKTQEQISINGNGDSHDETKLSKETIGLQVCVPLLDTTEGCQSKTNVVEEHRGISFTEKKLHLQEVCLENTDSRFKSITLSGLLGKHQEALSTVDDKFVQQASERTSEIVLDSGAVCSVSIQQSRVSGFISPQEKQLKRTTISCSSAKKDPKVSITILVQDELKDDVKMNSNFMKTISNNMEEEPQTARNQKLKESPPSLKGLGTKCDFETSASKSTIPKFENQESVENLSVVSCSNRFFERLSPATVDQTSSEKRQTFCTKTQEVDSIPPEYRGKYLNKEKRGFFEEKVLNAKRNKSLSTSVYGCKPVSPPKYVASSNSFTYIDSLVQTPIFEKETNSCNAKFYVFNDKPQKTQKNIPTNCSKNPNSSEKLFPENIIDVAKKFKSKPDFTCCKNNISLAENNQSENFEDKNKIDVKTTGQNLRLMQNVSHNIDADSVENNTKIPKRRATAFCLALQQEPILEQCEDEPNVLKEEPEQIQEVKLDDLESVENSNEQVTCIGHTKLLKKWKVEQESSKESKVICDKVKAKLKDYKEETQEEYIENKAPEQVFVRNADKKEATTMTSSAHFDLKSLLSSTSVQTDWSLVGITPEHFKSNKCISIDNSTRTVACQTEIIMNQVSVVPKEIEDSSISCKCRTKHSQFSELVSSDINMPPSVITQENSVLSADCHQNSPTGDVDNVKANVMAFNGHLSVLGDKNMPGLGVSPLQKIDEMSEYDFCDQLEALAYLESNEQAREKAEYDISETFCKNMLPPTFCNTTSHICSIPCLTCMSNETVLSNLSELSYKSFVATKSLQNSVPSNLAHIPNRGPFGCYKTADERSLPAILQQHTCRDGRFYKLLPGYNVFDKMHEQLEENPSYDWDLHCARFGNNEHLVEERLQEMSYDDHSCIRTKLISEGQSFESATKNTGSLEKPSFEVKHEVTKSGRNMDRKIHIPTEDDIDVGSDSVYMLKKEKEACIYQ